MDPSRRQFIRSSALLVAAPMILPLRAFGSWSAEGDAEVSEGSTRDPASRGTEIGGGLLDPPELAALSAALPNFPVARSDLWVLLSNASVRDTRPAIELLDATTGQVERSMRSIGVTPNPPKTRHLAVLFHRVEEYRAFARRHDSFDEAGAIGHYAPHARRCALSTPTPTPALRSAIALLLDAEGRAPANSASRGHAQIAAVDEAIDELRARTLRLTSHEAAHQVLAERGVHAVDGSCPSWLAEGLACAFETERAIGDFGPEMDVPARCERLQRALATEAHMPIGALVASPARPALGTARAADWYAQSWGLVAWLHRSRPAEFARYLKQLRTAPVAGRAAERLDSFEHCFGAVKALEQEWLRYWALRADEHRHAMPAKRPEERTST